MFFDNDVECKELCQELGVAYHRPPMPNKDPRLIKALLRQFSLIDGDYSDYQPQLETFDELEAHQARVRFGRMRMISKCQIL